MESQKIDLTIIGGGIIGLMTAKIMATENPQLEIALLEQAPFLADHSTGRNSGVLHSGLYYPTRSLKHQLCLEGIQAWKTGDLDMPILPTGKIVFASSIDELAILEHYREQARLNGVEIKKLTQEQEAKARDHLVFEDGFFVPSTAILDVTLAMKKLEFETEKRHVIIQKNTPVTHLETGPMGYIVHTRDYQLHSSRLINAGGLEAVALRKKLGLSDLESSWVKGHYLTTTQPLAYPTLYYPTPLPNLKGLGVHSTQDHAGAIKFGPNTMDTKTIDYQMDMKSLELMKTEIGKRFKHVDPSRLAPDYCGIRSKILLNGSLYPDFWIHSPMPGYVEACGIESPGLTSAPAIARLIIEMI
jgi:L-2-hydroxyglutarate oxidase LhgO